MNRRLLAEFVGTFVLVFAGTGAIVFDSANPGKIGHFGIALTFGLVVMAMVYAGFAAVVFLLVAKQEDSFLQAKFPHEFLAYAARVPRRYASVEDAQRSAHLRPNATMVRQDLIAARNGEVPIAPQHWIEGGDFLLAFVDQDSWHECRSTIGAL